VLIGCATHTAGDLLPEPLAFTTGTGPELLIVDPVLSAGLLVLAGWVADPGFVSAYWHSLTW
jgi:hypothetical protein